MDYLWSPWRYQYVSAPKSGSGCIFCEQANSDLVVFRGSNNFVLLNLFPYTSGHLMVVPYRHIATLEETDAETLEELMRLTRLAEVHLRKLYNPGGLNIGMNIGAAAGAGVADHIHMHVLPRWPGDVNFMTAVAETRVLPEDLQITKEKLSAAFQSL
jgi:ATP adenylyltransferase